MITKKVIAMAVSDVEGSFAITRLRLNLLLACPNLPSIALRILSSSRACFFSIPIAGGKKVMTITRFPLIQLPRKSEDGTT